MVWMARRITPQEDSMIDTSLEQSRSKEDQKASVYAERDRNLERASSPERIQR
jgi:hypothetical protein